MKRFVSLFVLLMVFGSVGIAAENVAVIEQSSPWASVIGEISRLIIDIISPLLVAMGSWAAWKLVGKFGIEKNAAIDEMLRKYVNEGINWADSWAKTQAKKPSAENKYAEAVKHIVGLIEKSSLPAVAEDKIKKMVESRLQEEDKAAPKLIEVAKEKVIKG